MDKVSPRKSGVQVLEDIERIPLFSGYENNDIVLKNVGDDVKKKLAAIARKVSCVPNQKIIAQGSTADNVFFILEGLVEVGDGPSIFLGYRGPGDHVGANNILTEDAHKFSSTARTPGSLLSIGPGFRDIKNQLNIPPRPTFEIEY